MTVGAVPQPPPSDDGQGTAIELALGERACSIGAQAAVTDPEAHAECVSAQIAALRADFGRDLRRLSAVERKRFDSACAGLNTAVTREAYLDCLNGEIAERRQRNAPARDTADAAATASLGLAPVAASQPTGGHHWVLISAGVAIVLAVPGAVLALRRRPPAERPRRMCACGQALAEEGAMCAPCRRAAAEALRRSAQQNQEEAQRRKEDARRQLEDDERRRLAERQAAEEAERQPEETLRLESDKDRIAQEAAALRRFEAEEAAREETEFDPYAVLGVARQADPVRIRAAYEAAKAKYQPDAVSHLGDDVRQHFRVKAEAVDRAYEMLSDLPS